MCFIQRLRNGRYLNDWWLQYDRWPLEGGKGRCHVLTYEPRPARWVALQQKRNNRQNNAVIVKYRYGVLVTPYAAIQTGAPAWFISGACGLDVLRLTAPVPLAAIASYRTIAIISRWRGGNPSGVIKWHEPFNGTAIGRLLNDSWWRFTFFFAFSCCENDRKKDQEGKPQYCVPLGPQKKKNSRSLS